MDAIKPLLDWLTVVGAAAGALLMIVTGLVALVKTTVPALPGTYYPALAVTLGVALGAVVWLGVPGLGLSLATLMFAGLVAGLMASGLWRGAAIAQGPRG